MNHRQGKSNQAQTRQDDLRRIGEALRRARAVVDGLASESFCLSYKAGGDPVTSLDRKLDEVLRATLPRTGEGWLSEESYDDGRRLKQRRVWTVDPLDGTREFLQHIPEWCVSIGLIEDGEAVAGGILNPMTGEMFLGSLEGGLQPIVPNRPTDRNSPPRVLVSRREMSQGKWPCLPNSSIEFVPVGSIAYRLALVATGHAVATCTFDPRHEWDIAGGVALVLAAGGRVETLGQGRLQFNQPVPRIEGLLAFSPGCQAEITSLLSASAGMSRIVLKDFSLKLPAQASYL